MAITGEIKSLYLDRNEEIALFPRTKTRAISDDNGIGLDTLLEHLAYTDERSLDVTPVHYDADSLGGIRAKDYATQAFVKNTIAEAQLSGGAGGDIDLSGFATKDDIAHIDFPVDSVNGKTGAVSLTADDIGALSASGGTASGTITVTNANASSAQGFYLQKTVDSKLEELKLLITSSGIPTINYFEDDARKNRMILYSDKTAFEQPVTIASGGTGAKTAADALANLGAMPKCTIVSTAGTTLNDYMEEGLYFFNTSYAPIGSPSGKNGWLQVLKGSSQVKQIWYRMGTPGSSDYNTFMRTYASTTGWGGWYKIITSADVQVLLWENASPTSAFGTTTASGTTSIALDLSDYDAVYVETVRATDDTTISGSVTLEVGGLPGYVTGRTKEYAVTQRQLTATTSGVQVSNFKSANTAGGNTNDLPYRIWGIRYRPATLYTEAGSGSSSNPAT